MNYIYKYQYKSYLMKWIWNLNLCSLSLILTLIFIEKKKLLDQIDSCDNGREAQINLTS